MRIFGVSQVLLAGLCLAEPFKGVNLGSWLVLEPWMVPSIFNSTNTIDEWHLTAALGKDQARKTLENHWSTFITRDDFAQIKGAGLNAVRIPLGYWAVDLLDYEPYVNGQYPYLVRAVEWAGEFGLKVFIDIHGAPGSQNGWEETGLVGPIAFFANTSNVDRTLNVLKNLTTEFSDKKYGGVVSNIELLNEPTYGYAQLRDFYEQGANVVGAGNSSGINTTISDAFFNPHTWENFDPWNPSAQSPAPHITVDTHQFWAFPPLDKLSKSEVLQHVCEFAQSQLRTPPSMGTPPTIVGEWSLSTGITANSSSDSYTDVAKRTWFRTVFEAQNAAYSPNATGQASIGWFFWSWKTEYDIDAWSYRKGLQQGYIPSNISNSSTYAFPIGNDGCIDTSINYTAPVLASSTSSALPSASASAPASAVQDAGATPTTTTKAGSANTLMPEHGLLAAFACTFLVLFSVAL